jgi:hypothetical protein
MTFENTTERTIKSFNCGVFPEPHEFTDLEIEAIASISGTDPTGTFADTPMEQSLIRRYKLEAEFGEHTWPGFAELLRHEKSAHLEYSSREKKFALEVNRLKEAIANYDRWKSLATRSANR